MTRQTLLTLSTATTDTDPAAVAAAEEASWREVYPDDAADPVQIDVRAAVCGDLTAIRLILEAAAVGLDGYDDPDTPPEVVDQAQTMLAHLRAEAATIQ